MDECRHFVEVNNRNGILWLNHKRIKQPDFHLFRDMYSFDNMLILQWIFQTGFGIISENT